MKKPSTSRSGASRAHGSSRSAQAKRLEKELLQALPKLDEEGLLFLLQQAQILVHNAQVDKLNRELAELKHSRRGTGRAAGGAAAVPGPSPAAVSIEEAEDKKAFFLALPGTRKVLDLQEMRRVVKICYAAESKSDALRQLYTVFSRERGDILADAKIGGPSSPVLDALFYAVRAKYRLEDR
jgi:hypothetical protein